MAGLSGKEELLRRYLLNFVGVEDDAEEFEVEIESDEVLFTVRVIEGDDEPTVFEYRVTALGLEPVDE